MLKKLLYGALAAITIVSCEKETDNYYDGNDTDYYGTTGLYVGITGFNSDLHHYYGSGFHILNEYSSKKIKDFISTLETDDGTILYYAMDNAISQLSKSRFPEDLKNVSIITFTDGLDQGSSVKNSRYESASDYLKAIQDRIQTTKVNGLNINAYSIGLKGQDVKDETQFKSNLQGLASSTANVTEVTSMNEVNDKFMQLAASLYKENTNQSLSLTIPQPYNNTRIRFTFDISDGDAADSECYIEGIFRNGALTETTYKGLTCQSGPTVEGENNGSINITFVFSDIQPENGTELSTSLIKQWEWIESSSLWQANTEFNPDKSTETTVEMQSAVIILLLDCSSSLGSDLEKIKQTARSFIDALSGPQGTAQVRFYKASNYQYVTQMLVRNQQDEVVATHYFGTQRGYSSYYEIPSGYHIPFYYYARGDTSEGYYTIVTEMPYTYYFAGGGRYTIACSDNGTYLSFDILED